MAINTALRENRINLGKTAERQFIGLLFMKNKFVLKIGQETWLPAWIHNKLRFVFDQDIEMMRHFPDLSTEKALIQVKSAPNEADYPFVTIEEASYRVSKRLSDLDIPVLIVWQYQNYKFYGQWAGRLITKPSNTKRENTNGSHTPMLLVDKRCLKPVDEFMREI